MKRIINGKKYDTETAVCLGRYANGMFATDFRHLDEALYQKKNGEFFLYGEGGPLTKYAVAEGNMKSGSEQIFPLCEEEAREWAEKHLDVEAFEEIFGDVEE